MHFLIDADSIVFKAGCANEFREYVVWEEGSAVASFPYKKEVDEYIAEYPDANLEWTKEKRAGNFVLSVANCKSLMKKITEHPQCTSWEVFIAGKDNFRKEIYPEYKATRDPFNRPIHENRLRQYLVDRWKAVKCDGEEVDDVVSYRQEEMIEAEGILTPCIVSIDKDLDNTQGYHYNYGTDEMYCVQNYEADLNFYRQLLTGDNVDNIPGLHRVGKKTAEKLLPEYSDDMCQIVWDEYKKRDHDLDYMIMNARLLWIRREREELWIPPIELQ